MSLRTFVILMAAATVVFWGAWFTVLFFIDPFATNFIGFLCFYVSLFFALMGLFTLVGFALRYLWKRGKPAFKFVGISIRQAIWFSLLIVASLVLQGEKLFTWWAGLLMVLVLAIFEAFFLSRSMEGRAKYQRTRS